MASHVLGKFFKHWPSHAAAPEPFAGLRSKYELCSPPWECQLVREILSSELELRTPICQRIAQPLHHKADPILFDLKIFLNLASFHGQGIEFSH